MTKYEIVKRTEQFSIKDTNRIEQSCTAYADGEVIAEFDTLEDALKELKKYSSDIYEYKHTVGRYYYVTEYAIEKCEYDEDGDPIGTVDVEEVTEMVFDVIEQEDYTVVESFRNLKNAERFIDEYEDDDAELRWELR